MRVPSSNPHIVAYEKPNGERVAFQAGMPRVVSIVDLTPPLKWDL